ncbi:MAG: ATP-binding cassette domain-containing protein [Lentisphaeraceae bacterium]|nr:ATP-binding cassette domain-containing protein [Lentisphaeraceae bacterium]
MTSPASISLFNLKETSVSYGDFVALKKISLSIDAGEKIAIIGPSGAGKSTLLKHLYESQPEKCSVIHQDFALIKQLSVFHNVYMGRLNQTGLFKNIRNFFFPEKECVHEIRLILNDLEIDSKIHTKIAALSGGQQQRVSICRALYHNAEVVLGDEPVSSLDPKNARTVIDKLMQKDKTVILSLHNVELALEYAQRIIALKKGKVVFDLAADQIQKQQIKDLYDQ